MTKGCSCSDLHRPPIPRISGETMHLLFTTDLGVKALVYMAASQNRIVAVADLAETLKAKPTAFKRPLKTLIDHEIISSFIGRSGGYLLQRDPQISLGETIAMLEQDLGLIPWMEPDEETGIVRHPNSIYGFAIEHAKTAFLTHLDQYTIADLAADPYTHSTLGEEATRKIVYVPPVQDRCSLAPSRNRKLRRRTATNNADYAANVRLLKSIVAMTPIRIVNEGPLIVRIRGGPPC
ncbi:Rrf2 family transcriptional regulator [Ensifer sp. MPMI2T]|nr:Rrf2 family transcriptional regulator [Ensifer sp. MPMI2T]